MTASVVSAIIPFVAYLKGTSRNPIAAGQHVVSLARKFLLVSANLSARAILKDQVLDARKYNPSPGVYPE